MNNRFDEGLEELKKLRPSLQQKALIRQRIKASLSGKSRKRPWQEFIEWKSILLTGLFLLISTGILFQLQSGNRTIEDSTGTQAGRNAGAGAEDQEVTGSGTFTWQLDQVTSEKTSDGYALFKDGNPSQAGFIKKVTTEEQQKLVSTMPIGMNKELVNFPYQTNLFIEHVKMPDVVLRYHFFITIGTETFHFSIDYPKLEYAEIFKLVATLNYSETDPYIHIEPLYATHGYGNMPYPVDLELKEDAGDREVYIWKSANAELYSLYIEEIKSNGWKAIENVKDSHTYEGFGGNEIVKITLDGNMLTYEYTYPNRDE